MPAVALIVEVEIAPGKRNTFVERSVEHRETVTRNELGCLRFDVLASEDDADKVFMYAVYANRSALETHFSTSYTQKYLESTKPLIARQKSSLCILAHV